MNLPQNLSLSLMQTQWAALINPTLNNPLNLANLLTDVSLIDGNTAIPHKLGRMMQGWIITDINGSATIYRRGPMNAVTLTLNSSAAVIVSLAVF